MTKLFGFLLTALIFSINSAAATETKDAKENENLDEIRIETPSDKFLISLKNKKFHFKSNSRDIQKDVRDCEVEAYRRLITVAKAKVLQNPARYTKPVKGAKTYTVYIGSDKYYVGQLSKEGSYIKRLNTKIDYVIAEGAVRCSQKQ